MSHGEKPVGFGENSKQRHGIPEFWIFGRRHPVERRSVA
jgi:hypothetical protein